VFRLPVKGSRLEELTSSKFYLSSNLENQHITIVSLSPHSHGIDPVMFHLLKGQDLNTRKMRVYGHVKMASNGKYFIEVDKTSPGD